MKTVKLDAVTKDYLWGGKKLLDWGYGKPDDAKIAEAWVVSFHKDGPSRIAGTDKALCDEATRADWGAACDGFAFFPLLVKLIDSADNLSVQVHPSDEYALKNEGEYGKTEMWYVVDCDEGAGLYVGLKKDLTKDELAEKILSGTVLEAMNFFPVKKGACYFIQAGTLHAIGKGCMILEIQQNSNLTYRVYDYGRVGADGKPRQLHIEKALKVTNTSAYRPSAASEDESVLAKCKYFTVRRLSGAQTVGLKGSFTALVAVADGGTLDGAPLKKGDAYFVPAGRTAELGEGAALIAAYVEREGA